MRKLITALTLVCILAGLCAIPAASAEMRGLWVDAFHPGFRSPAQTAAMVAKAKECNFNTLFVQVRRRGDVYYKSDIEPMANDVAPGYDPLADVIATAHAAGLQVHAWVVCFEVYHDSKWSAAGPEHLYSKHPEWLTKDDRGRTRHPGDKVFLDPGLPEVQEYVSSIVAEIVDGYQVDGIHLDAVNYSAVDSGYNNASLERFGQETGSKEKPKSSDKAWSDWRRSKVTQFMGLAGQKIRKPGKSVQFSAAVVPNRTDAYYNRLQDWVGWLNDGVLDFVVPMDFALDNRVFQSQAASALAAPKRGDVYIGQGGWRMSAADSMAQISAARQAGAKGVVVFSYAGCCKPRRGESVSLMDQLKAGLFSEPERAL